MSAILRPRHALGPWPALTLTLTLAMASSWSGGASATESSAAAAAVAKLLALPTANNEASPPASARPAVTVLRGETLDRVIRRTLPGQPFKDEFLRKAFIQLNPGTLDNRPTRILPAGTTLNVPSAHDLLALLAQQYPALYKARASEATEDAPVASSGNKRRWVQYP